MVSFRDPQLGGTAPDVVDDTAAEEEDAGEPDANQWDLMPLLGNQDNSKRFPLCLGGRCIHKTHWKHLRVKRKYVYYRCELCGVGWCKPRPSSTEAAPSNAKKVPHY